MWNPFLRNWGILLFLLLGFRIQSGAQDFSYTQVFAHTSTLNPALSGLHEGQYKASILYRNQWIRAVDKPFTMAGGFVDLRSGLPFKHTSKDAVGIGLGFVAESQGLIRYKKNNLNINAAYHKALDHQNTHTLSAAAQLGFLQNSVGFENITFNDQFDGKGFNLGTAEDLPINSINTLDFGLGLHYLYNDGDHLLSIGISGSHMNAPDMSFGNRDRSTIDETENILYRKYIGHAYYLARVSKDLQLTPRVITKFQGPNHLTMAGTTARIRMKGLTENAIHFGVFLQAGSTVDSNFKPHTASILFGYEFDTFSMGLSYDASLGNQHSLTKSPGNFELSITHFGFLKDDGAAGCPVF